MTNETSPLPTLIFAKVVDKEMHLANLHFLTTWVVEHIFVSIGHLNFLFCELVFNFFQCYSVEVIVLSLMIRENLLHFLKVINILSLSFNFASGDFNLIKA